MFPKKSSSGSFSSSPVFGPVARRNAGAVQLFTFAGSDGKAGYDGKHVKVTITGDTLVVNTDEAALTLPVAQAAVTLINQQIESIAVTAKPNTLRARATAARAYAKGKPWAMKRYSTRQPGAAHSDRLFNDSGSLAEQVRLMVRGQGVSVVTDVAGVRQRFVVQARLKALVPALRSLAAQAAIKKA